ncbi:hypothetical protein QQF64_035000 [Cirrhinus molitorella]|uniref:Uncharacterized protein n=1 Tax=Cirrhinus molitorella TaxID=172907 RepID=A0ABR3NEU6_9TELE
MMDPLADIRASQAERSSRGAAGGESADDQTRGCGRDAAMGGSDSLSSFADMEDSLEEKLKESPNLTSPSSVFHLSAEEGHCSVRVLRSILLRADQSSAHNYRLVSEEMI